MRSLERVRDLAAESLFEEKRISSILGEVPVNQVVSDDKRFQVREAEGGIVPEHLERVVEAIHRKGRVPAVIVWRKNGKLIVIDGRHRYEAYKRLGLPTMPAYQLAEDTPLSCLKQLSVMVNDTHGRTNTGDGDDRLRIRKAAEEVAERIHGSPDHSLVAHIKDVSSAFHVDAKKLKKEVTRLRSEMALEFAGFRGKLDCSVMDGIIAPAIQYMSTSPPEDAAAKLLGLAETVEAVRSSTSMEPRKLVSTFTNTKHQPASPGDGDVVERFQKSIMESCAIAVSQGPAALELSREVSAPAKTTRPPTKVKASSLVDALAKTLSIAKALDPNGVAPDLLGKIAEYGADLRGALAAILEFNTTKVEG